MKSENRAQRRREIMQAAYSVLAEKGYGGTSMLEVARRASASNETLYKWFGSKQGLFKAMVEENADEAVRMLSASIGGTGDISHHLSELGPVLLRIVAGEKAIALNRAASGDATDTGTLGAVIAGAGRDTIAPMLAGLFERARSEGAMSFDSARDVVEIYFGILIGDLQVRRVIGAEATPDEKEISRRSDRARELLMRLYGRQRS